MSPLIWLRSNLLSRLHPLAWACWGMIYIMYPFKVQFDEFLIAVLTTTQIYETFFMMPKCYLVFHCSCSRSTPLLICFLSLSISLPSLIFHVIRIIQYVLYFFFFLFGCGTLYITRIGNSDIYPGFTLLQHLSSFSECMLPLQVFKYINGADYLDLYLLGAMGTKKHFLS